MLTSMRLAIMVLAFGTAVAACGGPDTQPPASWDGPQRPYPADGRLPVDEFRAYAESVDESWERDPEAVVREYTRLPGGEITLLDTAATLERDDLEDDSVRAERYSFVLERDDGVWTVASVTWTQRCHVGRGHQAFSAELCV